MKRIVYLLLIVIFVINLVSCNSNGDDIPDPKPAPQDETFAPSEQPLPTNQPETNIDNSVIKMLVPELDFWNLLTTDSAQNQFNKVGLTVEIYKENDLSLAMEKIVAGEANAVGCSVATLARVYPYMNENNSTLSAVCAVAKSSGYDAVVAKQNVVDSISDIIADGKSIGVYNEYSGAYELLRYYTYSDQNLSEKDRELLLSNIISFNSYEEAKDALDKGNISALCVDGKNLDDLMTEGLNGVSITEILSSSQSNGVVVNMLAFDSGFLDRHNDKVIQFVSCVLQILQESKQNISGITYLNYYNNVDLFGIKQSSNVSSLKFVYSEMVMCFRNEQYSANEMRSSFYENIIKNLINRFVTPSPSPTATVKPTKEPVTEKDKEPIYLTEKQLEELLNEIMGPQFSLVKIYFDKNSAMPLSQDELNNLLQTAKMHEGSDILIIGRIANIGYITQNDSSLERAEFVASFLRENGIKANIYIKGVGTTDSPIAYTDKELAPYRRADIYFFKPQK